ncbi:Plastidic glucose transporter 4 [Vitis vinifera]|uniref:Plastidic glucose transporter 4 n=1 Tax=Vitis vinifera TaxID=29760 RepID=A0A438DA71_VITVI|nr:Plastidic glucose transporter 4 [Vitis vinifera]
MQTSTYAAKGSIGLELQNRRVFPRFGEFRKQSSCVKNLRVTNNTTSPGLRIGSVVMGAEFGRPRTRIEAVFRPRSVKARASGSFLMVSSESPSFQSLGTSASEFCIGLILGDRLTIMLCLTNADSDMRLYVLLNCGDIEDVDVTAPQGKSSGTVLPFVGVACLGAILFGYHLGVVNGALEYLSKDLGIAENAVLQGNTLLAGATLGSFTGGALADKFGRTRTFQLDAIPLAVGAFLCATAQSVQTMIIGRLLAGIGIGISSALVPLYISEISPTEIRGALGSVNQLFICIGILAALVAGLPLARNPLWYSSCHISFAISICRKKAFGSLARDKDMGGFRLESPGAPFSLPLGQRRLFVIARMWRTMFGVAVVPSILLALGMAFSPESPRWLFQQGKISEAEKSIKTLNGKERVAEVMNDLREGLQGSSEQEAGWFDLFSGRYWKVVSVGAALFLFQQLAGINAVVYYSTSVFRSAGIASDVAASALVGASNVFGTAIASSLMDRQGRKSLLITSFAGMAASMMLLSFSFTWSALAPYSGTLAVLGTVLYVLSFSLGAGPVPALLLPEIFASRIRAKAVALSLGMHWISNFVIGLYFLSVVNKFGISTVYLGFSAVCLLAVLYIAGNVVETKGRSLEEIERALNPAT